MKHTNVFPIARYSLARLPRAMRHYHPSLIIAAMLARRCAWLAVLVAASFSQAAIVTWLPTGGTNDWFGTNNWSTTNVPTAGDDVIINYTNVGVLLTNATAQLSSFTISNTATLIFSNWDTSLSATNITIQPNATLTCAGPFTNGAMSNRVWLVCSNLTIAAGGSINVNGKGYDLGTSSRNGQGPGGGTTGGNGGGGGGYGGYGGNGYNGGRGSPYGDYTNPLFAGSGGGGCTLGFNGSAGGGAVRIEATGLVSVDGTIAANGNNVSSELRGGQGSGGSIYITCNTFNGTNGAITAAGGTNSYSSPVGGAGGGGRIAIVYNPAAQTSPPPTVVFSAEHGIKSWGAAAQIGSLYFPDKALLNPAWMAHAGRIQIPNFLAWSVDSLTMTNGWLDFPESSPFSLTVTNALTIRGANTRLWLTNSALTCGSLVLTSSATLYLGGYLTKTNPQTITSGGNLELGPGCGVTIYAAETNAVQINRGAFINITNDIRIDNGASLTLYSAYTNGASAFLQMRNLTIATGGQVYADSAGYAGALASYTAGYGPGKGGANGNNSYGGSGGYGGTGGSGYSGGAGATYGNSNAPTEPGSGGGAGYISAMYGGGLVRVEARETVTVNGTVTANGDMGDTSRGSGSGGGIYIRCRNFSGSTNGILRANGGGGSASSGGGGGRIAVWHMYHFFEGTTSATNGTGSTYSGQPGTVYWGVINPPGTIFTMH